MMWQWTFHDFWTQVGIVALYQCARHALDSLLLPFAYPPCVGIPTEAILEESGLVVTAWRK